MEKPVILITGALTGIGRALAFANDGARLVVSGRRETEGKALEDELRRLVREEGTTSDTRLSVCSRSVSSVSTGQNCFGVCLPAIFLVRELSLDPSPPARIIALN